MKVSVEKQDAHVAQILLEIDAEQASMEYHKACRRISQRLNVPGFRRGKVPRPVVEKTVGVDRIKQEVLERLLPHVFADAISENQLDVIAAPSVETYTFDLSTGISVKAQVELRPEVTVPDLSRLQLQVEQSRQPEDALDRELQSLVRRMTTLEPVIDRPLEDNDIVVMDFTGSIHGELIRGGAAKNYRLDMSEHNFIDGFVEQLPGHRIGEEFTIKVTFPAEYSDNTLAGKQADFFVRVNDIHRKVVPPINDELARKVGDYPSLDVLKTTISQLLKENEDKENDKRKQVALVSKLVELASVDIPDAMVNREARQLQEEVKQRLKSQNISWEQYLDSQGHEAIWNNMREEALRRIKTSLVVGAVAEKEQIKVTDEEFAEHIQSLAESRGSNDKMLMKMLSNSAEGLRMFNDLLLTEKVLSTLMSRCDVEWIQSAPPESSATPPEDVVETTLNGEDFDVLTEE